MTPRRLDPRTPSRWAPCRRASRRRSTRARQMQPGARASRERSGRSSSRPLPQGTCPRRGLRRRKFDVRVCRIASNAWWTISRPCSWRAFDIASLYTGYTGCIIEVPVSWSCRTDARPERHKRSCMNSVCSMLGAALLASACGGQVTSDAADPLARPPIDASVPDASAESNRHVGVACSDCRAGTVCIGVSTRVPDPRSLLCTEACTNECPIYDGRGTACTATDSGNVCLLTCDSDTDCGDGWSCCTREVFTRSGKQKKAVCYAGRACPR